MIINMTGGGGGAALNFKVVPGLTQPGTASENTIWVKTERIGAWYFSATEPEEMQEWDVLFQTGTESDVEFNALRKNGLQVYPIFAKQYVSGSLVKVPALIYQNGEWVSLWNGELYDHGKEFEFETGGWKLVKEGSNGSLSNTGDELMLTCGGASNGVSAFTKNKIDLTNVKTVYFNVSTRTYNGGNNYSNIIVTNAGNSAWSHTSNPAASKGLGANNKGEFSVDVSALSGEYYVAFNYYGGNAQKIGCNKIWME